MLDPEIRSGSQIDANAAQTTLGYIRPRDHELSWQSIPWQTDLHDAVNIARKENKPVLLWAMNGNPLGCT